MGNGLLPMVGLKYGYNYTKYHVIRVWVNSIQGNN